MNRFFRRRFDVDKVTADDDVALLVVLLHPSALIGVRSGFNLILPTLFGPHFISQDQRREGQPEGRADEDAAQRLQGDAFRVVDDRTTLSSRDVPVLLVQRVDHSHVQQGQEGALHRVLVLAAFGQGYGHRLSPKSFADHLQLAIVVVFVHYLKRSCLKRPLLTVLNPSHSSIVVNHGQRTVFVLFDALHAVLERHDRSRRFDVVQQVGEPLFNRIIPGHSGFRWIAQSFGFPRSVINEGKIPSTSLNLRQINTEKYRQPFESRYSEKYRQSFEI